MMGDVDPLQKSKDQYTETIEKIASDQSAVGIDAQYTHAVIIDYLKQITKRLDDLEKAVRMSPNRDRQKG